MNHTKYSTAYYRGAEFSPGPIEPQTQVEGQVIPPVQTVAEAAANTGEAPNREREEWLEGWMKDIKTFIRNIDVSKL